MLDRTLLSPRRPTPENPDTNGVRFRSEQRPAGRKRRALACSMGYPSARSLRRHFITTQQFQDRDY